MLRLAGVRDVAVDPDELYRLIGTLRRVRDDLLRAVLAVWASRGRAGAVRACTIGRFEPGC